MKISTFIIVIALFFSGNTLAQNYRGDDSLLMVMNNFFKNTILQFDRTKKLDSNDIALLGIITVYINGGSIDKGNFHMHTEGYLKKMNDYSNNTHDRQIQDMVINKFLDKIRVDSAEDLLKLWKQASWNRDKAK